MGKKSASAIDIRAPEAFFNRELNWLQFAWRVLHLAEEPDVPLLERVKFAGIAGMLHDEFFMKRISGLKRQMSAKKQASKLSLDGRTPAEEFEACREMLLEQSESLAEIVRGHLRPALLEAGLGIRDWSDLSVPTQERLRAQFRTCLLYTSDAADE